MTRRAKEQRAAIDHTLTEGDPESDKIIAGRKAKEVVALVHSTMPNVYPELTRNGIACLPLRLTPTVSWEASLGNMLRREFTDDANGQAILNPDLVAVVIVDGLVKARRPIRITKDWLAGAISRALAPAPKPRPVELYDGAKGSGRGNVTVWFGTSAWKPTHESDDIPLADEDAIDWNDEGAIIEHDDFDPERFDGD